MLLALLLTQAPQVVRAPVSAAASPHSLLTHQLLVNSLAQLLGHLLAQLLDHLLAQLLVHSQAQLQEDVLTLLLAQILDYLLALPL